MSKRINYIFEIYEPGSIFNNICTFTSNTPFMAINAGAIVSPIQWESSSSALRVTNVEHIFSYDKTTITHRVRIYTEEINDTADNLLTR